MAKLIKAEISKNPKMNKQIDVDGMVPKFAPFVAMSRIGYDRNFLQT